MTKNKDWEEELYELLMQDTDMQGMDLETLTFHEDGNGDGYKNSCTVDELKDFVASQIEKTRREAKDVILHEINAKIDNITDAPSKPSDYKAWQKGFANAFEQVERIIKSCMKDIKNCEFCLDTGFMLCNGKNEPCVWCEKRRIKDKALGHGIEFGKHEGYEDGFKAGLQRAIELVPEDKPDRTLAEHMAFQDACMRYVENLKKEMEE